jgi:hypothetical protein
LTELDVTETDVLQRAQLVRNRREVLQQRERLVDGEIEYVGDRLAAVFDLESFTVVAAPFALLARDVHVRQKVHLNRNDAVPLARLATSSLDVERKAARPEAACLRLRQHREQVPDESEETCVGGGV